MIRWRFVTLGVTAVFAALFLAAEIYTRTIRGGIAGDFAVFWRAARLPIDAIYAFNPDERPFAYPPSAIPLMEAAGLLPFWPAYVLFVGAGVAAFYLSARKLYSKPAVLMGIASPAMLWAIAEGQVAPILAALVFLACSSRSAARGAILALVLSIKPQFAFFAPLVLWSDRKALVSMAGTGLILLLANVLLWGPETWLNWYHSLATFKDVAAQAGVSRAFVSLSGEAYSHGWPPLLFFIAGLIISAFVAIRKPIEDRAVLIVGCSIFASPYALPYDLVVIAPWAAERLLKDKIDWRVVPNVLLYTHMLFPVAWLLSLVGRNQGARAVPCPTSKASSA